MVADYIRNNKTMVIHVVRKNVLKVLISRIVKKVTLITHTTQKVSIPKI